MIRFEGAEAIPDISLVDETRDINCHVCSSCAVSK